MAIMSTGRDVRRFEESVSVCIFTCPHARVILGNLFVNFVGLITLSCPGRVTTNVPGNGHVSGNPRDAPTRAVPATITE